MRELFFPQKSIWTSTGFNICFLNPKKLRQVELRKKMLNRKQMKMEK